MPDTLLPQLQEPEAREAVAEAVMALLGQWSLHEINQARLLGLASVFEYKQKVRAGDHAAMERAGLLLAIDRALAKRVSPNAEARARWLFTRHERLSGLSPLSVMLEKGVAGMQLIKQLAEAGG